MKFFETSILIVFALWLLVAVWVALSSQGKFQKARIFLRFNGWFNQWTMFMPNKAGDIDGFNISYRDQVIGGHVGEWQNIQLEMPWRPSLFLSNPDVRMYGFMLQAVRLFAYMNRVGKEPKDATLYNFFKHIVLSYDPSEGVEKRQIRVEQSTSENNIVLLQSDFLILT